MSATVVAVCGDPGGANAVAPVIELLRAEARLELRALAYVQAHTLWTGRGLRHELLPEQTGPADIARHLARADFLLTGTSANRFDFEKGFIVAAREAGIPSLSVLDFWTNYALRFRDREGKLGCLPDRIAVMDELAKREMEADGVPGDRIVVTGHPAWDSLEASRAAFSPGERRALRERYRLAEDDWLILYASQPIPPADRGYAWFDREAAADALIAAIESLAKEQGRRALLLIRAHPAESEPPFRHRASSAIRIETQAGGDGRPWLLAADAVVGMATMLLVESALLGRPTLSLRLGLDGFDPFPANRSGLVRPVYRAEQIAPVLASLLRGPRAAQAMPAPAAKSSRNVADLVYAQLHLTVS